MGQSSYCSVPCLNCTVLEKNLKEKFNNPIALEVTKYVAVLQVLIKIKYRYKAMGFRVLGRCANFHTFMPRELTYCSLPTILAKRYISFFECIERLFWFLFYFFHVTCKLNISRGDTMCWQAQPLEHLTKNTMEQSSKLDYVSATLPFKSRMKQEHVLSDKRA